jgi:hypothetical protein
VYSTPLSLIRPAKYFKAARDMMLLFDDCIDFDGPMSDGWNMVTMIDFDDETAISEHRFIHDILSTLFRKFHRESTDCVYAEGIQYCLSFAVSRFDMESIRLILDFDPKAVGYAHDTNDESFEPPVHLVVSLPNIYHEILELLLDRGADIHAIFRGETATSMSLWFSRGFFIWHERLRMIYQDLEEFIRRETSAKYVLGQANWRHDTLCDLFALKPTETFKNNYYSDYDSIYHFCLRCSKFDDFRSADEEGFVEPWWEEIKHRVQNRQCICSLLSRWMVYSEDPSSDSLCRWCRELGMKKVYEGEDSGFHAAVSDSNENFDGNDNQSELYGLCKRREYTLLSLECFFYRQNGRWNREYLPGACFCFTCLAKLEGWEIDSDTEVSDEEGSDRDSSEDDSDTETSEEEED